MTDSRSSPRDAQIEQLVRRLEAKAGAACQQFQAKGAHYLTRVVCSTCDCDDEQHLWREAADALTATYQRGWDDAIKALAGATRKVLTPESLESLKAALTDGSIPSRTGGEEPKG